MPRNLCRVKTRKLINRVSKTISEEGMFSIMHDRFFRLPNYKVRDEKLLFHHMMKPDLQAEVIKIDSCCGWELKLCQRKGLRKKSTDFFCLKNNKTFGYKETCLNNSMDKIK